jgi:MarR family transcriptional regulator, organic hydroperoxide resistance regulator
MAKLGDLLCFQLGGVTRKIQKHYNNKFGKFGITIAQSFILFALLEEDGLNVKTLAERLILESSAITGLLDRLEKESLVVRQVDRDDRRAFRIFLTPAGRALTEKVLPIALEFNEALKSRFDEREQETFRKLIHVVDDLEGGR